MKFLKISTLLLIGFILHKAVYEIANVRAVSRYNSCIEKVDRKSDLSPYQQCKKESLFDKLEALLLYQPNFWCKYDAPFFCADTD